MNLGKEPLNVPVVFVNIATGKRLKQAHEEMNEIQIFKRFRCVPDLFESLIFIIRGSS